MVETKWRATAKSVLPKPVRRVVRAMLNYGQRVGRWGIILWQVRGVSWADEWILLQSAMASTVLSLRSPLKWQDPILLEDVHVNVSGIGHFTLRAHCDDLWHVLPWRERSIATMLNRTLNPGDVFIDAGANIGVYTILASRLVGPAGKVISIEMMPDTAERLAAHVQLNGLDNVTIVRNALSDITGKPVIATVQSNKYGQATIATDSVKFGMGKQVAVRTATLDDLTIDVARVHLMKVDLEGAELKALHGAKSLLPKLNVLVYESWGWKRKAADPVDDYLRSNGFSLSQLDGNNWLAERAGRR